MSRRWIALLSLAASFTLCAVPTASADHHFASVSEVYPGTTANPGNEFVELQMYADGQNVFTAPNAVDVDFYSSASSTVLDFDFTSDPPFGVNQRTILVGTAAADAQFSVTSDYAMPAGNFIDPAGGAVCFSSNFFGNIDCVSWGAFMNIGSLPGAANPASPGGIPNTQSIHRSLARGCATLLEAGDDTNNSAADFAPGSPTPRPNTLAALGGPCTPGGSTPPTVNTPPAATPITSKPARKKCKKAKKGAFSAACKKKKKKKR